MGRGLEQKFFQKKICKWQGILNITNHQENAKQNHNKTSSQTCRKELSKRQEITSADKNVEKRKHLCTVGGNVNWFSHYGEQYGGSLKK